MEYSKETNELLCTMLNENGIDKSLFPHDVLKTLFDDGIIRNSSDYHNNNVYLTDKGKAHIEQLNADIDRYNEEKRRSWIQFWVPLVISNVIAIAALIVAILAYKK